MASQGLADLEAVGDLRQRDPARARELAIAATTSDVPEEVAVAYWIVGLADHELGEPGAATEAFGRAIAVATDAGLPGRAATAQASMAISLQALGRHEDAASAIHAALHQAGRREQGFVRFLHGLLLQRGGQLDAAAEAYTAARPLLEETDDRASLARLLLNQGTLKAYRGDLAGAVGDFAGCEGLATDLDLPVLVAMAAHNAGFALGRRGDVPGALEGFSRAAAAYRVLGDPDRLVGVLDADRCEVLLEAGLVAEAREAAEAALERLGRLDELAHLDEATLLAARADLAAGELDRAIGRARQAADSFRATGRQSWAALADYVALQGEVGATEDQRRPPPRLITRARTIARALEREGWPIEAAHVRTFVGRMALATGRTELARRELARMPRTGTIDDPGLRIQACHATALLRLADHDRRGAVRAVRRGLAILGAHRESLGASDLRAGATARGDELARLGVRLALADGAPAGVLHWAERHRASTLRLPPARPPADPALADLLARLRQAQADLQAATLAGRPLDELRTRLATTERGVRDAARLVRDGGAPAESPPRLADLRRRLGNRVLVEYVASEGGLYAVVVEPRRTRLIPLGEHTAASTERHHLVSALRRQLRSALVPGSPTRPGPPKIAGALRDAARRLDDLVLAPLDLSPSADLVVVPTGSGHGLPWAALPSLAGRSVTIAPSAALWCQPPPGPPPGRRRSAGPLLVAGPALAAADQEVAGLAGLWPDARVLTGARATTGNVLAGMGEAELVHLAAHGSFRADSPLFSSLRLADGDLTVYDLEHLPRAPVTVVLPACSAAAAAVRTGDELLGTTAALVGIGVRSVVAPVLSVPDLATARFSLELHRHLASGRTPSEATALAAGQARENGDPLAEIVAASFLCVGADDRPATDDLPGQDT